MRKSSKAGTVTGNRGQEGRTHPERGPGQTCVHRGVRAQGSHLSAGDEVTKVPEEDKGEEMT